MGVDILDPRKVDTQPRVHVNEYEILAIPGRNLRVDAFIRGRPSPTVILEFGDVVIFDSSKPLPAPDHPHSIKYAIMYYESHHFLLTIRNVSSHDEGRYTIRVENRSGEDKQHFNIAIANPPSFTSPLPPYLELLERWGGSLTCRVEGKPYPKISWYKDWKRIAQSSRFQISSNTADQCSMVICNAMEKDTGQYTCVAENTAGRVVSHCYVSMKPITPYLTKGTRSSYEILYF